MSATPYAQGTTVPVQRSMAELSGLLTRAGASGFVFGTDNTAGMTQVQFRLHERVYRFEVPVAVLRDFHTMPSGRTRDRAKMQQAAAAEDRRRWRALVLVVKALLVGITDGVMSAEDALLAFTVLPDGSSLSSWVQPQLLHAYATGGMPALLPGPVPTTPQLTSR